MNKVLKLIWHCLLGLILIVVGFLIITNKTAFIKILTVSAGVIAFLEGLYTLINIHKWQIVHTTLFLAYFKAFSLMVLGPLAVYSPFATAQFLTATFVYFFAVGLIFSAAISIQNAIIIHKSNSEIDVSRLIIDALIGIIFSIVLFINPEVILDLAITIIGIVAIIVGVVLITLNLIKGKAEPVHESETFVN